MKNDELDTLQKELAAAQKEFDAAVDRDETPDGISPTLIKSVSKAAREGLMVYGMNAKRRSARLRRAGSFGQQLKARTCCITSSAWSAWSSASCSEENMFAFLALRILSASRPSADSFGRV